MTNDQGAAAPSQSSHEVIEAMTLHAVWSGRFTAYERKLALESARISRCAITDCPHRIATWMVSEMAPGRPLVYGVCERDAAMIHMAEMPDDD